MKLAYWSYSAPAHIGTLRVASSFRNVHAVMHAPLGDDYFNVLRSMLERESDFTPVTTSVVDRHVLSAGSKDKVVDNLTRKGQEDEAGLVILTPTCTSSILQEDLKNFTIRAALECHTTSAAGTEVLLADTNHYRVNEFQAADRTLEQIVELYCNPTRLGTQTPPKTARPSVNIIGLLDLGFHNTHDYKELRRLFTDLGITVLQTLPEHGDINTLKYLPQAWFNFVPYREAGHKAAAYLSDTYDMPYVTTTPMGVFETARCIREITAIIQEMNPAFPAQLDGTPIDIEQYIYEHTQYVSRAAWFSRSIDCQNLTGKRAVVFGDATHAAAMTQILAREMGVRVVSAGTYCKHDADWFKEAVGDCCDEVLISDTHVDVQTAIERIQPAAIFGTQMERHIGKRLGIPCGVISAPVHIQNFPLGYRPFLGFEGSNHICDLIYNSFTLGMEDHLLEIFGGHDTKLVEPTADTGLVWSPEAQTELGRIPGFVRQKVRRNTELFATTVQPTQLVTPEIMFQAKEHWAAHPLPETTPAV
jgi:light-independent protochlorophyllide reductase subunit B